MMMSAKVEREKGWVAIKGLGLRRARHKGRGWVRRAECLEGGRHCSMRKR